MAFRHARRPSFPSRLGTAVAALGFSLAMLGLTAPMAAAATACSGGSGNLNVNVASGSSTTFQIEETTTDTAWTIYISPSGLCDPSYPDVTKLTISGADSAAEEVIFDFGTYQAADYDAFADRAPGGSRALRVELGTGTDTVVFDGRDGAADTGSDAIDASLVYYQGVDAIEMNGGTGTYSDTLVASGLSIPVTFDGGAGDDTLVGGSGADSFYQGTSADGGDSMSGGGGTDTVDYSGRASGGSNNVTVTIGAGTSNDGDPNAGSPGDENDDVQGDIENVIGTSGADHLTGSLAANVLTGGPGGDTLDGGAGNDTLVGGGGGDHLTGGTGTDTVSYQGSAAVVVDLSSSPVTATGGDAAGDDVFSGVENLTGSSYGDKLTGDENANVLSGGAGNDTIEGRAGADVLDGSTGSGDEVTYAHSTATVGVSVNLSTGSGSGGEAAGDLVADFEILTGSPKNDTLTGTSGEDEIHGGYGDDTLAGLGDGDVLDGGNGSHDRVSYAASATSVEVSLLAGSAKGGDAADDDLTKIEDVTGSAFDDLLIGSRVSNNISGGDGADMISGGLGNDVIDGGAGKDTVGFASAVEGVTVSLRYGKVTGGDGSDTLTSVENAIGSAYADTINGGRGANLINGGGGGDTLTGSDGADRLYGGTGSDTLVGGSGNDALYGGGGDDKLDAGDGTDACNAGPGKNTLVSCEKLK